MQQEATAAPLPARSEERSKAETQPGAMETGPVDETVATVTELPIQQGFPDTPLEEGATGMEVVAGPGRGCC